MTGIAEVNFSCLYIIDGIKQCDKHVVNRLLAKHLVGNGQALCSRIILLEATNMHHRTAHSHEDGSRNTLTAHVSHHQTYPFIIYLEIVIEVTTNIFGRFHGLPQVELAYTLIVIRHFLRQDGLLNLSRYRQIALNHHQL